MSSARALGFLKTTNARPYLALATLLIVVHVVLLYGFASIDLSQYAARGDGSRYMMMAQALGKGQLVSVHFPLYPALISIGSLLLPVDLTALAIPPIFHVLFALTVYKIFEESKSKHPWLYSLTLALFPPSALIYSSSSLSDAVMIFFVALVFYYGLKGKRNRMVVASFFAVFTHYYAILLIVPIAYWLWRTQPRKLPLAFVPVIPIVILSVAQFFARGDLFYYLKVPTAATFSWGTGLLAYPYASLVFATTALTGLNRIYWSSYLALVFLAYGVGLLAAAWRRSYWRAVFAAPFYLFSVMVGGYYFVPRFLWPSFPSLMEFATLERHRAFRWILVGVIIASTVYAIWFLLIRVPASGFAS
jgi:hypothetical protein